MSIFLLILSQVDGSCTIERALTSYEVWKDFILPIWIALFAGYMVYWAFVKETKRDKEKQLESEGQMRIDKLTYFANLVKNIISFSEQMNVIILDFVKEQRKDPIEVKQLLLFSLNEYRRVTTDLQLESYMLAYVNFYKGDRQLVIKEFNNIVIRIDTLYGNYKKMEPHLELIREDERKKLLEFSECQRRTSNLTVSLSRNLRKTEPYVANELNQISLDLASKGHLKMDTIVCYRSFFVPLNNFALKYMGADLPERLMIQELALLTRDGKSLFEQIISSNKNLADEFQRHYESLNTETKNLKTFAEKLLADFGLSL